MRRQAKGDACTQAGESCERGMDMIERLTSLEDPRLDAYARLTEVQLRNKLEPEKGIFIAESDKVIDRALDAGCKPVSLVVPTHRLEREQALINRVEAVDPAIPVFVMDSEELEKLSGFELTRGVLCAMHRPALLPVEDVVKDAKRIAILEDITNHTNVGAAFRSAAALGIDALLVTPACCDPLYRRAVRVSMGTVFQVPWTRIGTTEEDVWPKQGLALLSKLGFTTLAMALEDDSLDLDDPRLKMLDKVAIVLGTEGDGLSAHTIAACDWTVRIPMAHGVDSLNVAAASAVAFWELRAR